MIIQFNVVLKFEMSVLLWKTVTDLRSHSYFCDNLKSSIIDSKFSSLYRRYYDIYSQYRVSISSAVSLGT